MPSTPFGAWTRALALWVLALLPALAWCVPAAPADAREAMLAVTTTTRPTLDPETLADPAGRIEVLDDATRNLDIAQVMALPASRWQAQTSGHLGLGYGTGARWVRLRLHNSGGDDRDRLLTVDVPHVDWIDAYVLDGDRVIEAWHTGNLRPFATRPVDHRAYAFPLRVPARETRDAVLRLDMRDGVYPRIRLEIKDRPRFDAERQVQQLGWGMLFGAMLAMLGYNLLLFLSTGVRSFLLYAVYLGAYAIFSFSYFGGFGFQWLWPEHPAWNRMFDVAVPALLFVAATAFVADCLSTRQRAPRTHRALVAATAATQIFTVVELTGWVFPSLTTGDVARIVTASFIVASSALTMLYVAVGLVVMRGGYRPARFFVLAWIFPVLGILVHRLVRVPGLLPANALTENSIIVGSTIEFLLLALTLADRFKSLKDEALAAERRVVEAQRADAVRLEEKVRERTSELDRAMTQIERSLQLERRAREEQREFLGAVSHDLRTPLALISTIAQNLKLDAEPGDDLTGQRYDRILKASERMSGLLDDYLDEERFELLREPSQPVPTDLGAMLEQTAAAARVLAEGHVVRVAVDGLPPVFRCDPELTQLALRNLADNAVKHTPPGTTVILRGTPADAGSRHGVRLEVIDDGPGIRPRELERLFKPGSRGHEWPQRSGKGMGLVLARRHVERQGGTLTVASTPGAGCCFTIWLPVPPDGL